MFEDVLILKLLVIVLVGYINKWLMYREIWFLRCLFKIIYVLNRFIRCEGNGYLDKVKRICVIIL